jgi:hypothetical protein
MLVSLANLELKFEFEFKKFNFRAAFGRIGQKLRPFCKSYICAYDDGDLRIASKFVCSVAVVADETGGVFVNDLASPNQQIAISVQLNTNLY